MTDSDEPDGESRLVRFLNSLRTEAGAFRVLLWTLAVFLPLIVVLVLLRAFA